MFALACCGARFKPPHRCNHIPGTSISCPQSVEHRPLFSGELKSGGLCIRATVINGWLVSILFVLHFSSRFRHRPTFVHHEFFRRFPSRFFGYHHWLWALVGRRCNVSGAFVPFAYQRAPSAGIRERCVGQHGEPSSGRWFDRFWMNLVAEFNFRRSKAARLWDQNLWH